MPRMFVNRNWNNLRSWLRMKNVHDEPYLWVVFIKVDGLRSDFPTCRTDGYCLRARGKSWRPRTRGG